MQVDYIDHMGSDLTVVNAARVSFNKHSKNLNEDDKKLITYLAKHHHWSPFAHCFVQFRVKAPMFVARQLAKHQVGLSWNEVSRRYVDTIPEFYTPPKHGWRSRAANIKQGSGEPIERQADAANELISLHERCLDAYLLLLEKGVAPEQARMVMPQSTYTEWYWSGSLYAFARVCAQRIDQNSQLETANVALWIDTYCTELFPYSWEALTAHIYKGDNDNESTQSQSVTS